VKPERVKTFQFRKELARLIAGVDARPVEVTTHGGAARAYLVSPSDYKKLELLYNSVGAKPLVQ
jgi:PHD/YefM family antitoxin component YafN of YafNO toxin-antitoxin module